MRSASRRAFLTGKRVEKSPWENFLARLRRRVEGQVQDLQTDNGTARLIPAQMQDVYSARSLCIEYGITMALDGLPKPSRLDEAPLLWVDPGSAMAKFNRLGPDDTRWFVQPGCLIGELEQAGLSQFKDQPPHLTVAAWLADRQSCDWGFANTRKSGLVHAMLMLADGTHANLGAFGIKNQKPLDNMRVQAMIPKLFELAAGLDNLGEQVIERQENTENQAVGNNEVLFDCKYRLDALKPADGLINLSHLLLGHGGELGWVEWLVLDENQGEPITRPYDVRYGNRQLTVKSNFTNDLKVRALFDPDGLFPDKAQKY